MSSQFDLDLVYNGGYWEPRKTVVPACAGMTNLRFVEVPYCRSPNVVYQIGHTRPILRMASDCGAR